ncbi:MAG TPA: BsuPI-related putative proteinase inhibitor [Gammaproteobacteria bacterium]|nr:BsuPI-related putative proteinase inhibitor [Gammaproteobacteria bacterium]
MKLKHALRILAMLPLLAALLGASQCQQQEDKTDGSPLFVTTLSLEDTNGNVQSSFSAGETLVLKLTVYNRSDAEQTLWFNTGQMFNFVVVDEATATTLWNWSAQQTFSQSFTKLVFQAHETQSFTVNWDQTGNDGELLPVGNYEIFAGLTMYNRSGEDFAADNADAMAQGVPEASQMTPTQYRSILELFTLD